MKKTAFFILFLFTTGCAMAQTGKTLLAGNTGTPAIPVSVKPAVVLYPNPARNKVVLQLKGFAAGMAQVNIVNDKGRVVRSEERLLINGDEEVVMFLSLQPGIYFVKISEKEKEVKKRLVVLQ